MRKLCKALLSLVLVILLVWGGKSLLTTGFRFFQETLYPVRYEEIVGREADRYHLDPALVYAVIRAESSFRPKAVSGKGAYGLMQITEPTFEWLQTKMDEEESYTVEDLYRPEINIRYGCKLLSILLSQYSSTETALCAYNAGMGRVGEWLSDSAYSSDGVTLHTIPFPETENYVSAVMENYSVYHELYQFQLNGGVMHVEKK